MDRGAWSSTLHSVTKNKTQLKRLSMHTHVYLWLIHVWRKPAQRCKAIILQLCVYSVTQLCQTLL